MTSSTIPVFLAELGDSLIAIEQASVARIVGTTECECPIARSLFGVTEPSARVVVLDTSRGDLGFQTGEELKPADLDEDELHDLPRLISNLDTVLGARRLFSFEDRIGLLLDPELLAKGLLPEEGPST